MGTWDAEGCSRLHPEISPLGLRGEHGEQERAMEHTPTSILDTGRSPLEQARDTRDPSMDRSPGNLKCTGVNVIYHVLCVIQMSSKGHWTPSTRPNGEARAYHPVHPAQRTIGDPYPREARGTLLELAA